MCARSYADVPPATLLAEIAAYCRRTGLAQTNFGRLAMRDAKFVTRLKLAQRVTAATAARARAFMLEHPDVHRPSLAKRTNTRKRAEPMNESTIAPATSPDLSARPESADKNFRFYDNRQKYLLFVHTCGEKWAIAHRVAAELDHIVPRPPAIRMFDAGTGDGTVLTRVMRAMHQRFPTIPLYVVGKEISLEDVRLTLEKMPDRFQEHPATVLVLTNMFYAEAPWLRPRSVAASSTVVWQEVALGGSNSRDFEVQLTTLQHFLAKEWRAGLNPKSGNPVYERPVVLTIYRDDHRFVLDPLIPRRGDAHAADYDLVIASQPYRARASAAFKAKNVIVPLARSVGPNGRLIAIHSHGQDPGLEIIEKVWPGDNPFQDDRRAILDAVSQELDGAASDFELDPRDDEASLFRYYMHTLPDEVSSSIGTSTLFAAWNAAIYVAQIEDQRLEQVIGDSRYLDATRDVLTRHNGLWFWDESYVIARKA